MDIVWHNRERITEYDFVHPERRSLRGVSAMLRVRNESGKIVMCLSSILSLFDEIVLVDNGSTDETLDLVKRFKSERDGNDVIRLLSYPHTTARYGDEHWATPEDSVHSVSYYYNWCLSNCHHAHVFKWDADMVVAENADGPLRELFRGLRPDRPQLWAIPVQTVYKGNDRVWYLARGEINKEPRLHPNRCAFRYHKGRYFERLASDSPLQPRDFEHVCIYELKDVAEDEFAHWDTTDFPTPRKQREWRNYNLVSAGDTPDELFERLPEQLAAG